MRNKLVSAKKLGLTPDPGLVMLLSESAKFVSSKDLATLAEAYKNVEANNKAAKMKKVKGKLQGAMGGMALFGGGGGAKGPSGGTRPSAEHGAPHLPDAARLMDGPVAANRTRTADAGGGNRGVHRVTIGIWFLECTMWRSGKFGELLGVSLSFLV